MNFTIFIKNFIEFPTFNVKHKNMVENLRPCIFHPTSNRDCPIFGLDYIINEAEQDQSERDLMLLYGGVIRVKIDWDCNLDRRIKYCKPKYSFARLDTPFREETFSVGFNFRFAYHWKHDQTYSRSLTKAYGLRLIISVSGKAGKFDFITLTLNTGSLVGIFGLATFVCDVILLHLTKKAPVYRDLVFQRVHASSSMLSVSGGLRDQQQHTSTIYSNPDARVQHIPTLSCSLLESIDNHHEQAELGQHSALINANELLRFKPSLGLTNAIH
jgi:hypothetical protein